MSSAGLDTRQAKPQPVACHDSTNAGTAAKFAPDGKARDLGVVRSFFIRGYFYICAQYAGNGFVAGVEHTACGHALRRH